MLEFKIPDDLDGVRLDKFLRKKLDQIPTSHLFKMIRTKKIRVNGKRAQPDQPLVKGDVVTIRGEQERLLRPLDEQDRPTAPKAPPPPQKLDLKDLVILLEDDWLMAIDKPSGMAVHTGSGITGGTVVDYVRQYLGPRAVRNDFAASPAHRLDRETSGVLLVAKRRPAMVRFTEIFTLGTARKRYLVLVKGRMPKDKGTIDLPLSEHQQTARSKAARGVNMQEAVTRWQVLQQTSECALLSCTIETGRTHQIRRHFAAIGHPVAGDRRYGDFAFNRIARARWGLKRLFLHAERIEFPHPEHGAKVTVVAPMPPELSDVLKRAGINHS